MATERIQIIVTSKGTVTVRKDIEGVGKASDKSAKSVDTLKGVLASIVTGATLGALARYSDAFTGIENKLKLVTSGQEELRAKTAELLGIANESYNSFDAIAALYQRTTTATENLGISSERVTGFVSSLAKTVTMSGSSAIEAENAIRQLTQGLASGQLRGEEFRSVSEQLPMVLQVLQQALGKTAGQLREMAFAGELTPQLIIEAFEKVGPSINQNFGAYIPTIGNALVVLNNNVIAFVGYLNQMTGASGIAAQIILLLANNLDLVALALAPLGAALVVLAVHTVGTLVVGAFTQMIAVLGSTIATMGRLLLLMAANPFVAIGLAIAGVILYFVNWEKAIYAVVYAYGVLKEAIGKAFGNAEMAASGLQIQIDAEAIAQTLTQKAAEIKAAIVDGGKTAAEAMRNGVAQGGNQAAGAIKGAAAAGAASAAASAQATYEALNGVPQKIKGAIKDGGDYLKNEVTGEITKAGAQMKTGITQGGADAADGIQTAMEKGASNGGKILYENIEQAFANNVRWLNDLYKIMHNREKADFDLKQAEAEKARAEAEKLRAEADQIRRRHGSSGSGSGGGGGGRSPTGQNVGREGGANYHNYLGAFRSQLLNKNEPPANQNTTTYGKTSITNVFDPNMLIEAQTSSKGQKAMINNVKANRDEIRAVLGIA